MECVKKIQKKIHVIPACIILTDFQCNPGLVLVLFFKCLRSW